jgi:D-xylose transport system substrate-binding protein
MVLNRHKLYALAVAGVLSMGVAACGEDEEPAGDSGSGTASAEKKGGKVAVLLPDSKSSVRWETYDRPLLQAAFERAGIEAQITNAEGDKSTQQQQAEQAITNGAKVILLTNLDSGSGAAIAANAKAQGVKVIDYDRLTLNTDATDYYVSFDNEAVGKLQGRASWTAWATSRARASRSSTARRRTTTPRCSRTATTRSSTRSSRPATGRRSTTSPCPTGTTRRR